MAEFKEQWDFGLLMSSIGAQGPWYICEGGRTLAMCFNKADAERIMAALSKLKEAQP